MTDEAPARPKAYAGLLYDAFPAFAAALDDACAHLDVHLGPHLGRPLKELMLSAPGGPDTARLAEPPYAQAAAFALETALHRLTASQDAVPFQLGEVTAAYVSGTLSLADAARLAVALGELTRALLAEGVPAQDPSDAPLLAGQPDTVTLAAVGGERSVVASGTAASVAAIAGHFTGGGRRQPPSARQLPRLATPSEREFHSVVRALDFRHRSTRWADPAYWTEHARRAALSRRLP